MKKFDKVVIIGVGEIGGSIGKCLKKKRLARQVIGVGRHRSSLRKAIKANAVDKTYLLDNIYKPISDADLVILATPVAKIIELGKEVLKNVRKNTIVTDVGSTKKVIVEQLEKKLSQGVFFVGSHPMAGSEKGGVLSARSDLFAGRDCFITKTRKTKEKALLIVKQFWKSMGARPIEMTLAEHDKIVAQISHMVHLVASGLVIAAREELPYAASGFRDTTRIASADSGLWIDICATNSKNIAESLDKLIKILKDFRNAVLRKDVRRLRAALDKAKELRGSIR